MNALIIGSTAMYHWFPDARKPKDLDLLTPAKIVGNHGDVCVVDAQWHEAAEAIMMASTDKVFATPNVLLTLKVAHAHWNVEHQKTLFDIKFLQDKGAEVIEHLYLALIPVFTARYGKNKVTVNKPMREFFTDAVPRAYDHEWLHEKLAFHGRPIHERLRPDMGNVWCSRELFERLSYDDQCACALEEILVTAVERRNLTTHSKRSELLSAVYLAHHKLCTTMASGWFARFNIEHHHELLINRRIQWMTHLTQALSSLPPPTPGAFYQPSLNDKVKVDATPMTSTSSST
jgi:hypothetical protein